MAQQKLLSPTSPGYIASTQPLINKSQYLAQALESLNEGNQDIKGGLGEVAARLGATYLLKRGQKKNDAALSTVVTGQRKAKSDAALAGLGALLGNPAAPAPQAVAPTPAGLGAALAPSLAGSGNNTTPAPAQPLLQGDKQPLSVRNNNPGNLKWDGKSQWKGMTGVDPKGFVQFLSPEMGSRAAGINLGNQQKLHGINTLSGLITKYAPKSDNNDTAAYVQTVAQKTGLDPNAPLNLQDPAVQAKILPVMFGVESGGTPAQFQAPQPQQPQQQAMAQPTPQAPAGPLPGSPPAGQAALQANPAGGVPQGQFAHAPVDPQEITYVKQLLQSPDPAEQEAGYAMYQDLQKRAMTPVKYEVSSINGVPTWSNPYSPGEAQTSQVPQGAMSRNVSAQEAGISAPEGTTFSQSPTGQMTQVYAPPQGFQTGPQGMSPVRGGPADPATGQNLVTGEGKLRDDYNTAMKQYQEARNGYQKVVAAAKDGSGASDIALIFGFMKTLDPGSTVREGEFATAQNSGSISQTVLNAYNKALKGERLQPDQRAAFAKTARSQFQVHQQQADDTSKRYSSIASSYGYDPSRIVQTYAPVEAPPEIPQSGPRGAQKGPDGNYYAPDPTKPGSFPQAKQAADGKWYIKVANPKPGKSGYALVEH